MKVIYFLLLMPVFFGCKAVHQYDYKTSLRSSTADNNMCYEDDSLRISFYVEPKLIAFRLDNKLAVPISINWDEMALLIDKEHHKVMRTEMGIFKEYERQPPTLVAGGSYIRNQLVPVRNLKTDEIELHTKVLSITDFLPQQDNGDKAQAAKIKSRKGSVIELRFPFYIQGKQVAKTFYITIDDVIARKTGSRLPFQKS